MQCSVMAPNIYNFNLDVVSEAYVLARLHVTGHSCRGLLFCIGVAAGVLPVE